MVVGAAQLQDCSLLLTEDLRDGAVFGGVRVRSPFTLALEERAAVYAVRPVPATRHRAPGRPRRRAVPPRLVRETGGSGRRAAQGAGWKLTKEKPGWGERRWGRFF